eukprot:jgi/Tetstr1/440660/TSEL_028969.t1
MSRAQKARRARASAAAEEASAAGLAPRGSGGMPQPPATTSGDTTRQRAATQLANVTSERDALTDTKARDAASKLYYTNYNFLKRKMEVEDDDEEKEEKAETGDEGSGASDSDEPQRARRNRPTGLRLL